MYVGLHAQRDDISRMVFISETKEGDSLLVLICRNYPYGTEPAPCPIWILPNMPAFKTNVEAEAWLRAHSNLLEEKVPSRSLTDTEWEELSNNTLFQMLSKR